MRSSRRITEFTVEYMKSNIKKGIYPFFYRDNLGRRLFEMKKISCSDDPEKTKNEAAKYIDELTSQLTHGFGDCKYNFGDE